MRTFKSFYVLLVSIIFIALFSVNSYAQQNKSPLQVTEEFYSRYMDYYFKMIPPDSTNYKSMMNEYVSPRFNKKIKQARICLTGNDPVCSIDGVEPKLGYVYIIRAQDAYDDWIKIKAETINSNASHSDIKVSLGGEQEKPHVIMVSLKKNDANWKIDNVSDYSPAPYRFQ